MSARLKPRTEDAHAPVDLCLLGTGGVGNALLARIARQQALGKLGFLRLTQIANSRQQWFDADGLDLKLSLQGSRAQGVDEGGIRSPLFSGRGIVIDATASDSVASRHGDWLRAGHGVVSANKLGIGADALRYRSIQRYHARYGDAATVGAGLPILQSLRALVAGGDSIREIAGILSGSLAYLFDRYDGSVPFTQIIGEARRLGYTEPDPRIDLCGADVARKLRILLRAAGQGDAESIAVTPLLPADADGESLQHASEELDAWIAQRHDEARRAGKVLRYVARWRADRGASVGLEALSADDELATGGISNRLAIRSDRYDSAPLLIQGPGAGNEVTAAAVLDDVLRVAAVLSRH